MIYRLLLLAAFAISPALAADPLCAKDFSAIINNTSEEFLARRMERIVLEEIPDSYKMVERLSPERIELWNKTLLKELRDLPMTGEERGRSSGLSLPEIHALYKRVATNRVADYSKPVMDKYDPDGKIGFCFGRASAAHWIALQTTDIAKENIKKIWAIGTMKYNQVYWAHHVASIVRDKNGVWHSLDPEYGRPLRLPVWYQKVKAMDADGRLQLFVTPAKRFGPGSKNTYNTVNRDNTDVDLTIPFYNNYFTDLLQTTREEAAEIRRMREASGVARKMNP
ncbi:MAG: hypothetical protein AB7K68_10800 [Bacteriovoracia bacterium]